MDASEKQEVLRKLLNEAIELQPKLHKLPKNTDDERKSEKMTLLHQYNEIKDATQVIIGALANLEMVTVKSIHQQLNLPEE